MNEGEQPCNDFRAQRDEYYDNDNLHDCYAKDCKGSVSLCENCLKDHHSGGYGNCTKIWTSGKDTVESLRSEIAGILGGLAMVEEGLLTGKLNPYQAARFLQGIMETKEHLIKSNSIERDNMTDLTEKANHAYRTRMANTREKDHVMKHTPLNAIQDPFNGNWRILHKGKVLFTVPSKHADLVTSIVQAVNSHAELVAALENAKQFLHEVHCRWPEDAAYGGSVLIDVDKALNNVKATP